jgi:hypothetical protein
MSSTLRILKRPVHGAILMLATLAIGFGLWLNVTNQFTDYGTGGGRFADQVDSYSEYLIRNSVLNDLFGTENVGGSLVITRGYRERDYGYYADGTQKYFSNRAAQRQVMTWLARLNVDFVKAHPDRFFQLFRLLNSLLLAICLAAFFTAFFGRNLLALAAVLLSSLSSGFALFASNLYFMTWLLLTPLFFFPALQRGHTRTYVLAAFLCSIAYFMVRYEFATLFALLWFFPVLAHALKTGRCDWPTGTAAFVAVCFGFAVALAAHHFAVASENGIRITDASALVLHSAAERVASLQDVPAPFTTDFIVRMGSTWSWPALDLPRLLRVSKLALLGVIIVLMARTRCRPSRNILIWSVLAYVSWYVFAYQHIVFHAVYDSLLFAATIYLALVFHLAWLVSASSRRPAPPDPAA